jgi:hypothetical protein
MNRKKGKKNKRKSLAKSILHFTRYPRYFAYAIGVLYVVVVAFNIPLPILNTYSAPTSHSWLVTYPPSPPNTFTIVNEDTTMIFLVNVTASQPIADGVMVIVTARGCEGSAFVNTVKQVTFGFVGAK